MATKEVRALVPWIYESSGRLRTCLPLRVVVDRLRPPPSQVFSFSRFGKHTRWDAPVGTTVFYWVLVPDGGHRLQVLYEFPVCVLPRSSRTRRSLFLTLSWGKSSSGRVSFLVFAPSLENVILFSGPKPVQRMYNFPHGGCLYYVCHPQCKGTLSRALKSHKGFNVCGRTCVKRDTLHFQVWFGTTLHPRPAAKLERPHYLEWGDATRVLRGLSSNSQLSDVSILLTTRSRHSLCLEFMSWQFSDDIVSKHGCFYWLEGEVVSTPTGRLRDTRLCYKSCLTVSVSRGTSRFCSRPRLESVE